MKGQLVVLTTAPRLMVVPWGVRVVQPGEVDHLPLCEEAQGFGASELGPEAFLVITIFLGPRMVWARTDPTDEEQAEARDLMGADLSNTLIFPVL